MRANLPTLLAAAAVLASQPSLPAQKTGEPPVHSFEFKIAKQRESRDKKGNSTTERWNYKVEVENRSLQDVGELEAKYTVYITTETRSGGSRRETTRSLTGEAELDPIARGNRSGFETKSAVVNQSVKTERKKSKKGRGKNNNKKKPAQIKVTEVREKLDGISVRLFLDGKMVGEHLVGDAAKRAAIKKKK